MSKWDRLIEYLKTTSAKPDAVLASVKAMWPVKGKKEITGGTVFYSITKCKI